MFSEIEGSRVATDLMNQNAELQAEADSRRTGVAEKRHSPTQVGAPNARGTGPVLESELQSPSPPQGGAQPSVAAAQGVQSTGNPRAPFPTPDRFPRSSREF